MGNDLALLGALVASRNLTYDDAAQIAEFVDHVETLDLDVPDLTAGIDLALGYFNDAPEVEEAKAAEEMAARADACERGVCPDCGEPSLMDAVDDEQSVDLWMAVRGIVDKYMWDQMQMHDHGGPEIEEC